MICFAWHGFPQYAARCVGALVNSIEEEVVVVATRPGVPIEGMERLSNCRVFWVKEGDTRLINQVIGEMPSVLFVSGWKVATFNRYRDQVRYSGGRVIAMSDNNYASFFKEVIKSIRFRLFLRSKYNGFLVPGKSGMKLLRFYGVPSDKIRIGMYAADVSIFNDGGEDICRRSKKIIFVGQFSARKNPLRLCEAFRASEAVKRGWTLELYGCGPLKDRIPRSEGVFVYDFAQPEILAEKYREARVFCLPSLEEHWGLVVHEAALSGCILLLSNVIGAKEDFVGNFNGFLFSAKDQQSLERAINNVVTLSDEEMRKASAESISLGRTISLESFVKGVQYFL